VVRGDDKENKIGRSAISPTGQVVVIPRSGKYPAHPMGKEKRERKVKSRVLVPEREVGQRDSIGDVFIRLWG